MQNPVSAVFSCCSICGKPVELENSNTDTNGLAVHEECYAKKVAEQIIPSPKHG